MRDELIDTAVETAASLASIGHPSTANLMMALVTRCLAAESVNDAWDLLPLTDDEWRTKEMKLIHERQKAWRAACDAGGTGPVTNPLALNQGTGGKP